jgi:chromosome segregation ATPase
VEDLEKEIADMRENINELHKNLSKYNLKIDKYKIEHIMKDSEIEKKEDDVAELQRALIRHKDTQKDQLDHINNQHNSERRIWKENSERTHQRVIELEKAIRT